MTNSLLINSTGISGSLTNLADGSSYLIAGDNVTIVSGSNGSVTISAMTGSTPMAAAYGQINIYNNSSFTGPAGSPGSSGGVYPVTGTWNSSIAPNNVVYDLTNGFMEPQVSAVFEVMCQAMVFSPIEAYAGNPTFEWGIYQNGSLLTASVAFQDNALNSAGAATFSTVTFGGLFSFTSGDLVQPKVTFTTTVAELEVTYLNFFMRQIV